MAFNLDTFLNAARLIVPAVNAAPAVLELIRAAATALDPDDQPAAKQTLAELIDANDAGHARLQDKLRDAAGA